MELSLEKCFYKKEIDTTNIPLSIYCAEELFKEKPFDVVVSFNETALEYGLHNCKDF